ncbi:MAG TPA: fibronectin type III domain-containing protein [Nitrospira sp.]|nr:fibronectin type III domain-containing protein [Nitrospira sp.]
MQDPASGAVAPVTHLAEQAGHPDFSSAAQGAGQAPTGQTEVQSSQTTQEGLKSVTLGWDPSASQNVLGYRVYLVTASSPVPQMIDVGSKTEMVVPLKIGESYGFTVTAYNAFFESEALPYFLFQVF